MWHEPLFLDSKKVEKKPFITARSSLNDASLHFEPNIADSVCEDGGMPY
jgi:hypothetical protein